MSKQIQKQKLTFEDIAPYWSSLLKNRSKITSLFSITSSKYCIVGEAYGFPEYNYQCSKCKRFAWYFVGELGYDRQARYRIYYKPKFEKLKNEFVDHWNEKHT